MSAKAVHHHLINNNNNNNNNNMISSFVSVIEDTKALSLSDEKERSPQHEPQLGNESSAAASDDLVTLHLLLWLIECHRAQNTNLLAKGEVSLYAWPPVLFVWIQLLCSWWINNRFTCLVKSKPVKQEVSCTMILPRTARARISGHVAWG